MRFSFAGTPRLAASRAAVWERLMDPAFVAASAPGVESVERIDATRYRVLSGVGLGAIRLTFTLDVQLTDLVPPEHATILVRGSMPGSTVDATARVRLEDAAAGGTTMHWATEHEISGAVAGLGGRLLEPAARRFTEQFWESFAARVAG